MQVRLCKGMGSGRMRWFMDTYLQHVQPSTWDFHHRSLPGPSSKRRAKGLGPGSQGMGGCHQWYSHDAHGKKVFCIFNCQFFIRNLPSWFPPKKTIGCLILHGNMVKWCEVPKTGNHINHLRVPNHTSHATAQCLGRIGCQRQVQGEADGNREAS